MLMMSVEKVGVACKGRGITGLFQSWQLDATEVLRSDLWVGTGPAGWSKTNMTS